MADMMFGLDALYGLATSQGMNAWLNLGINLFLSTIIGGIVLVIIFEIFSKAWKEQISVTNVFLLVFIINVINLPIIFGFLSGFIAAVPFGLYIVPLLIWIVFSKLFFRNLSMLHAVIVGIVGFILSMILIPNIVVMFAGFLPSF